MFKFEVAPEVFRELPDVLFGVVYAQKLDNKTAQPKIEQRLAANIAAAEQQFHDNTEVRANTNIALYRAAFRTLAINPNKYKASIEALLSRVAKQKGLPRINPLVDLGNAISLQYQIPIGAHDAATLLANTESVRFTTAGDAFVPFGETTAETPDEHELVYVSGHEVRTRRWIWRQSQQGEMTPDTQAVFFPLDGFTQNKAQVLAARDDLAQTLQAIYGVTVTCGLVDVTQPTFIVE
ncbi:B3/B4 domain-containing protein [Loigolactobacillus binensis]|uniref:B3/4 domain-containing protein n=1 Tax=Loigolactobacillus binensis TaxID=2559922 RepID=A0ABW3EAW4_9LACO|nr:phenylalanine--tRNA ligase beta subunit-related protein [Loigolactobacillus binensis]